MEVIKRDLCSAVDGTGSLMIYGMDTMTLNLKSANKLRTTKRAIEKIIVDW